MARRKIYSNLNKIGQYRPDHVDGQTLYKVFQCLNPDCTEMITVKKDDIDKDYSIICPKCGYEHYSGGEQHLFDFSMDVNDDNGDAVSVQEGEFVVSHDEYIENTALYKLCNETLSHRSICCLRLRNLWQTSLLYGLLQISCFPLSYMRSFRLYKAKGETCKQIHTKKTL